MHIKIQNMRRGQHCNRDDKFNPATTGASKTRYRCRNRYRNRVCKFIAYRSADSDSDYDYENYKKYKFLYDSITQNDTDINSGSDPRQ